MSLDYAILGFLQSADLSGYDLKRQCFDYDVAHFWTADQAQVYRTLDRLEARGDVSVTPKRQRNKPDRRVYSITGDGRDRLREWAEEPHPLPPYRDPFLIQIRFSDSLDDESIIRNLRSRRDLHQDRLDVLRHRAADLGTDTRETRLARMTLDAAIAHERASIDWLDQSLETPLRTTGRGAKGRGPGRPRSGSKRRRDS